MKQFLKVFLCSFLLLSLTLPISAQSNVYAWYCVRNKEHKQPQLGSDVSFIEKYGGYYVDKKHGDDCTEKVVYLTFDAGYENGNIEKILDAMKRQQVTGAFFVLSNLVLKNPELICRMNDEGHLICNHTSRHRDMSRCESQEAFEAELSKLEALYYECTGKEMSKFFRPPEGKFSEKTLKFAHELGYKTIFWSFAYEDWNNNKQMSSAKAKEKILSNIHNGAILLLHPTSDTNAAILEDIIVTLKTQGYSFGTLEELVA